MKTQKLTLTKIATEFHYIRCNLKYSSPQELIQFKTEVDRYGAWLSAQKTSKRLMLLLSEAHELATRLDGMIG